MQRQRRSSLEIIVQPWDRTLVPSQGMHITISLSSSAEIKPHQMEDVNHLMKPSSFQRRSRLILHYRMVSGLKKYGPCTHPHPCQQPSPLTIKLLTSPQGLGTHSFECISLLWPSWPGKAIKIFFF